MGTNGALERSRILGAMLPEDLAESARLHTMLEVAFLAAAADGQLADAEIEHLVANLQAWLGAQLETSFLEQLFDDLGEQLAAQGAHARLAAAAAALDQESRRVAYRLACVTALCDLDVHDDELRFLGTIADAFAIPSDDAQAIFDELDDAVTAALGKS
jgi:hypothetical protein